MSKWLRSFARLVVILCFLTALVWRVIWPTTGVLFNGIFIGLTALSLLLVFVFKVFD